MCTISNCFCWLLSKLGFENFICFNNEMKWCFFTLVIVEPVGGPQVEGGEEQEQGEEFDTY